MAFLLVAHNAALEMADKEGVTPVAAASPLFCVGQMLEQHVARIKVPQFDGKSAYFV